MEQPGWQVWVGCARSTSGAADGRQAFGIDKHRAAAFGIWTPRTDDGLRPQYLVYRSVATQSFDSPYDLRVGLLTSDLSNRIAAMGRQTSVRISWYREAPTRIFHFGIRSAHMLVGAYEENLMNIGGVDGTRTRDPRRDRPVF